MSPRSPGSNGNAACPLQTTFRLEARKETNHLLQMNDVEYDKKKTRVRGNNCVYHLFCGYLGHEKENGVGTHRTDDIYIIQ